MITFFRSLRYIPTLIRSISIASSAVEAFSGPDVTGAQKKALVLTMIDDLLSELKPIVGEEIYGLASLIIDIVVKLMNRIGMFRHKGDDKDTSEVPQEITMSTASAAIEQGVEDDPELRDFLNRMSG